MNEHKRILGRIIGPGGLRCACCNPYHKGRSQKHTKRFLNRKVRRRLKDIETE